MERYYDNTEVAVCFTAADSFWPAFYFVACITLFFVVPLVVLLLLYSAIAYKLLRRNTELHRPAVVPSPLPTILARQQSQRMLQIQGLTTSPNNININAANNNNNNTNNNNNNTANGISNTAPTGSGVGGHNQHLSSGMRKHRKQVIFMLVAVVASFFICLLPFRAFTLWVIAVPAEDIAALGIDGYYNVLYFCRIMLYLNSALNPILYNLMSSKFRTGFWRLIVSCCGRTADRTLGRRNRRATTTTTTTTTTTASASRRQMEAIMQGIDERNRELRRQATFVLNSSVSTSSGADRVSWRSDSVSGGGVMRAPVKQRVSLSTAIIEITASTMATTACSLTREEENEDQEQERE